MKKHNCHFLALAGFSYQPILTMLQVGTSIHMIQTFSLTDTGKWIIHLLLVLLIQMITFWIQIINLFFKDYFLAQTIFFLKYLLNLSQYCFSFSVCLFFGHEACGILAPLPGIKPLPPALEGEVLTIGLPEKSPDIQFLKLI